MFKNAAAVLLTVLQLNQLKHAQQDQEMIMGLRPSKPAPKQPESARPFAPLNPSTSVQAPAAPLPKKTPAAEIGKTPEAIAQAAGAKAGPQEPTGSVLMPPTN